MNIIPLLLQRRFEQRRAVRFAGDFGRTKEHRIERLTVNIVPRAKRKIRRVG
jgi:hypothetical protein